MSVRQMLRQEDSRYTEIGTAFGRVLQICPSNIVDQVIEILLSNVVQAPLARKALLHAARNLGCNVPAANQLEYEALNVRLDRKREAQRESAAQTKRKREIKDQKKQDKFDRTIEAEVEKRLVASGYRQMRQNLPARPSKDSGGDKV